MSNKLQVVYKSVDSLAEYKANSRTHDEHQITQLVKSINEFGFTNPLLIDGDGVLIAGHGRLLAARRAGLQEVPCIELGHLTDAQRRAYVIADNKLAELSGWDEDLLAQEIAALTSLNYSVDTIGFSDVELASIILDDVGGGLTDKDYVPDLIDGALPITHPGDCWLMDGHVLLCGDSTSADNIAIVLNGRPADMVWTDPPYNVNYESANGKKIANDNMSDAAFYNFLLAAFKAASTNIKPGGAIYIAHADSEGKNFRAAMVDAGFLLKQCIIWIKNSFAFGRQDYQWKHEPILYGWMPGAAHCWYGERNKTTVIDNDADPVSMSHSELIDYVTNIKTLLSDTQSVIRENKPKKNGDHPTMKPVALIMKMLKNSSTIGDVVLDIFGGSGSTLIAAEQLKRRAALIELSPQYCDVIVRRWQEYTGKHAVHRVTGKTYNSLVII